jgi:hypothetical protein
MYPHPGANQQRAHCEAKGPTAMTHTPNDDQPGFVAEKPEHGFACYRLIRPGQTYYLNVDSTQSSNGWEYSARMGGNTPGMSG